MEISKVHDVSILHLFGEVTFMEIDRIERTLNFLKNTNNCKVLIDMASVDYIHYAVIKRLIFSAQHFRNENGDIKLASLNPETREMIRFTGADQHLEDYATITEAILSFLKPGEGWEKMFQ